MSALIPHTLGQKIRARIDSFAPAMAYKQLRRLIKEGRLKGVFARLFDMAESDDDTVALQAIKEIIRLTGYDSLREHTMKALAAKIAPPAEDDPEEREALDHAAQVLDRQAAPARVRKRKKRLVEQDS